MGSTGPTIAVVTGASGYVASELVHQLLAKGWTVRATVRSTKDPKKTSHLTALGEGQPGKLELHEADLLKAGSFDDVVKGADYVFHTASPFILGVDAESLLKPALEGTQTVLQSVVKSKDTIKRVVLTSSFAAIMKPEKGPANGKLYTEEDWNDEAKADPETGYLLSKVKAEKEAWKIAKENGLDLVVINPTGVFGPVHADRVDGTSVKIIKGYLENNVEQNAYPYFCDVRDIAKAHIAAAEKSNAKGRYLVTWDHLVPEKLVLDELRKAFPQYKITHEGNAGETGQFADVSKAKKELGITITPWQTSVIDNAKSLIERGLAKPVSAK